MIMLQSSPRTFTRYLRRNKLMLCTALKALNVKVIYVFGR